jgi:hypothetical protein
MAGLDSNTKLLLHLDGADGATTTSDATGRHNLTFSGTAQLDTAQTKFGSSSLLLDGDSDYISSADSADWDIAGSNSDNWTVDFWIRVVDNYKVQGYISQWEDNSNFWTLLMGQGSGICYWVKSNGSNIIDTGYIPEATVNTWTHIALCKVGNKWGLYKDGDQLGYATTNSVDTFAGLLYIGRDLQNPANYMDGWIDEVRIQHSNDFNANPNVGTTDTITVPTFAYGRRQLHGCSIGSEPAIY